MTPYVPWTPRRSAPNPERLSHTVLAQPSPAAFPQRPTQHRRDDQVTGTRFADRVVIATGTASGLGLATARQFAAEGAQLVLVDRAENPLNDIVAELTA